MPSSDDIADVYVHDNYTLVKYQNDSFMALARPKSTTLTNAMATNTKSGVLNWANTIDQLVYRVESVSSWDATKLFIYMIPGSFINDNYLTIYNVTQFYTNGALSDITIAKSNKQLALGKFIPPAIALIDTSYMVLGFPDKNNYNGSIELYNSTGNFTKILSVNGEVNSAQFGASIKVLRVDLNFIQLVATQATGGFAKNYFLTPVNLLRNTSTGAWSSQI